MKKAFVTVAGFAIAIFVFSPNHVGGDAQKEVAPRESTVALVGPIPLGELFRNMRSKELRVKWMAEGEWPDEDDIIAALNKTKMWIRDSKRMDSGNWKLDFDDHPGVLLEGPLFFDLKNKKDADFVISIKEVVPGDTGFGDDNKTRRMTVTIRLNSSPYRTAISSNATGLNVFSDYIIWDLAGKVRWIGKEQ
jgi:hypothetical protein